MPQIITIKLTKSGPNAGPFEIIDNYGNVIATDVPKRTLIRGISYEVNNNVTVLIIKSLGKCKIEKAFRLTEFTTLDYGEATYVQSSTACLWRHLTDIHTYNYFYGNIEPYIIEYPFAYQYYDEILQNVKDYTKAYEYIPILDGVFSYNTKV